MAMLLFANLYCSVLIMFSIHCLYTNSSSINSITIISSLLGQTKGFQHVFRKRSPDSGSPLHHIKAPMSNHNKDNIMYIHQLNPPPPTSSISMAILPSCTPAVPVCKFVYHLPYIIYSYLQVVAGWQGMYYQFKKTLLCFFQLSRHSALKL